MAMVPQFKALAEAIEQHVIEKKGTIAISIDLEDKDSIGIGIYPIDNIEHEYSDAIATFTIPKRKD